MEFWVENLTRSGIKEALVRSAGISPLRRADILDLLHCPTSMLDPDEMGYKIPYFDLDGNILPDVYNIRLKNGATRLADGSSHEEGGKRIKYLKPQGCPNKIYMPPGFLALAREKGWFVLTEGEKKALKSVQEGIPCAAVSGVWNWADSAARAAEKLQGKGVGYATLPIAELLYLCRDEHLKCIILFDSDAALNRQVRRAAFALRDSLLYHGAEYIRATFVPLYAHPDFKNEDSAAREKLKLGLDDWLCLDNGQGVDKAGLFIKEELSKPGMSMSPLFSFPYDKDGNGQDMCYYIPNYPKHERRSIYPIKRDVEKTEGKKGEEVAVRVSEVVARTRIWVNSIVPSIDDNTFSYEMGYIPLASGTPCYITGGSELITLSGRGSAEDYGSLGAQILTKERGALEEFWHACQVHGVPCGAVRQVPGTQKRGWVPYNNEVYYVTGNRVYDGGGNIYAAEHQDIPLLPLDGIRTSDTAFKKHGISKGDEDLWRRAIIDTVLPNPLPTLTMAAALASPLRYWCPDSENFVFHLYGTSTAGKTTAIQASASLWGDPAGLIEMWRATTNGIGSLCVARNHTAMFLDESTMVEDPETPRKTVFLVGNGRDKLRSTVSGGSKSAGTFQLVLVSTGEKAILGAQRNAGEEVRALEVLAGRNGPLWGSTVTSAAEAERFAQIICSNYGFGAPRALVEILKRERGQKGYFRELHAGYTAQLRDTLAPDTPPHIRRRVKHYGLLMTAASLMLTGALGMSDQDAQTYLASYAAYIADNLLCTENDQFTRSEDHTMIESFNQSLIMLAERHFMRADKTHLTGDFYGEFVTPRGSDEATELRLLPVGMEALCAPFDTNRVVNMLAKNGILVKAENQRKNHTVNIRFKHQSARAWGYRIDMVKLNEFVNGAPDTTAGGTDGDEGIGAL